MRKLILPITILSSTALFIYGCKKVDSNDLKDEVPYHQSYNVSYDKKDNSLKTTAEFRIRESSGAKIELTNGASIKINGNAPGTSILDKTQYTWQSQGMTDVSFVLTKNSGQTFTNTVSKAELADIDFPSTMPSTISKASGISFTLDASPIKTGQNITLTISGRHVSDTTNTSKTKILTTTTAELTVDDLKNIKTGTVTIELTRNKSYPLDAADGTAGGSKTVKIYNSKELTLSN
jgi:hypothetical protein